MTKFERRAFPMCDLQQKPATVKPSELLSRTFNRISLLDESKLLPANTCNIGFLLM